MSSSSRSTRYRGSCVARDRRDPLPARASQSRDFLPETPAETGLSGGDAGSVVQAAAQRLLRARRAAARDWPAARRPARPAARRSRVDVDLHARARGPRRPCSARRPSAGPAPAPGSPGTGCAPGCWRRRCTARRRARRRRRGGPAARRPPPSRRASAAPGCTCPAGRPARSCRPSMRHAADLLLDRDAGIVADPLPHAGQRLEQRRLARVRVADQGDGQTGLVDGGHETPKRTVGNVDRSGGVTTAGGDSQTRGRSIVYLNRWLLNGWLLNRSYSTVSRMCAASLRRTLSR